MFRASRVVWQTQNFKVSTRSQCSGAERIAAKAEIAWKQTANLYLSSSLRQVTHAKNNEFFFDAAGDASLSKTMARHRASTLLINSWRLSMPRSLGNKIRQTVRKNNENSRRKTIREGNCFRTSIRNLALRLKFWQTSLGPVVQARLPLIQI